MAYGIEGEGYIGRCGIWYMAYVIWHRGGSVILVYWYIDMIGMIGM
jgi:hypothetical protein